jgi:subtilisin-like proprotein convertase family protein
MSGTKKMMTKLLAATLMVGIAFWGCAQDVPLDEPAQDGDVKPDQSLDSSGGKEDRWNWRSAPTRFGEDLNFFFAELPSEGVAAEIAWPSTYWPTYEDGIQHRWNHGEMSPAEKYDLAFNGWTPPEGFDDMVPFRTNGCSGDWTREYYDNLGPLATYTSRNMGNRRARDGVDSDGDGEIDECGDNDGVETWWGLCHAWVPASMLEHRPLRSVTYNGVTFHTGDLEALLIAAYNRTGADMIGGRCNSGNGDDEVERDEHGRATNLDCRDTNPGSFHVIVTNFLGILERPFAMDRTYDYQVWNQPVIGYNIVSQRQISVAEANELLGLDGADYSYNPDAATLHDVTTDLKWITEAHASTTPADPSYYTRVDRLSYILELDADGKIIGGEWYGRSRTLHPDFLWNPRRIVHSSVPHLDIDNVRMLIELSRQEEPTGDAHEYVSTQRVDIPDDNPTGATSRLHVADSFAVGGVQVQVNIRHTYIADLRVTLTHNGTEAVLHANEGGSADNIERSFVVNNFDGQSASGNWELHVVDSWGQDTGHIAGFTLRITGGEGGGNNGGGTGEANTWPADDTPISIPDNNGDGIASQAHVPDDARGSVAVSVNISHTWIGDLRVVARHGDQEFVLHDRTGGSQDNLVQRFPINEAVAGGPGGTWTLHVSDHAGYDTGTLESWSVVVTE